MFTPSQALNVNKRSTISPAVAGSTKEEARDGTSPESETRPLESETAHESHDSDQRDADRARQNASSAAVEYPGVSVGGSQASSIFRAQNGSANVTEVPQADAQDQILTSIKNTTPTKAVSKALSRKTSTASVAHLPGRPSDDTGDTKSIRSTFTHREATRAEGDLGSLLGDRYGDDVTYKDWRVLEEEEEELPEEVQQAEQRLASHFDSEFVELDDLKGDGSNEESLRLAWSLKLKHFLVLSSAGKPIYSRHGDDQLISGTIGVIQTILSFYEEVGDDLKSLQAGEANFTLVSKGHLHLVAISRLGENDMQLRAQLDALYMQILSTLTLPNLQRTFLHRPSADIRRSLEGTESLLSALADGFSRGSPSTLLSALECLRLRKTNRAAIHSCLIKARSPSLLYGLIVTGIGQLVSVIRPRKHSLHPGDLHLIFNMLFEAKGIRTGGGENWIPLCLPGFNNTGYVYMHVSYLDVGQNSSDKDSYSHAQDQMQEEELNSRRPDPQTLAVILISTSKEAFDELRKMRDDLMTYLRSGSLIEPISNALKTSRRLCTDIIPGTPLQHFLFKSRANVQFVLPSAAPEFSSPLAWRQLMCRYSALHGSIHNKTGRNRVVQMVRNGSMAVAWVTQIFEIYAVAAPGASKMAIARGLERLVQWAKQEEDRLFVVGGAVF